MPDNSTDVKVGKLIALLVEKGDDWKNVEVPKIDSQVSNSEKLEMSSIGNPVEQNKSTRDTPSVDHVQQ
jgi:hypothetical protein